MAEEITSFPKIMIKIQDTALNEYDGKLFENVYPIFNSLTIKERRIVLKRLISLFVIVNHDLIINEKGIVELKKEKEQSTKNTIKLNDELIDMDAYNELELIKLKTFLVKLGFCFVVILIVGGFGLLFTLDDNLIVKYMNQIWELLKFMWKV